MVQEVMSRSVLPVPVQYVMLYVGAAVSIVSGIAMLKGRDWARFLYVIWSAIGFVVGMVTSPMKALMIPSLAFYVILVIFLFRPKASRYFRGTDEVRDPERG